MRAIGYLLYLVLIAFHEVIFRGATSIAGVSINLPAIIVFSVALFRSEAETVWFALAAALVMSAGTPLSMGFQVLAMVLISLAIYHAREQLNVEALVTQLAMLIVGVLIHNSLTLAFTKPSDFWFQMARFTLPGTIYTGAVAYLIYTVIIGRFSSRRSGVSY
ncbi:hypothetical protein C3F09_13060 [candidate division GN15 bacterium]|uniref:Rod shape-determining protein MreD n=1 Tax=candidate division GN15 bacterium TaxID=2072418 RepID=A0A855X1E9_9BACT|nr:MAG: hypothetical protein C3F09_13060 [candidate division GN15 bacterium]